MRDTSGPRVGGVSSRSLWRAGLRRLIGALIDPVGSAPPGPVHSGRRGRAPVRGAWESACGWEARWQAWLANSSTPVWRGDGEERQERT